MQLNGLPFVVVVIDQATLEFIGRTQIVWILQQLSCLLTKLDLLFSYEVMHTVVIMIDH